MRGCVSRIAAMWCAVLVGLLVTACSTTDGDGIGAAGESVGALPFVGWYQDPETGQITRRWVGPFVESRSGPKQREEFTLRPLFSTFDDPANLRRETIGLWPLYQSAAAWRDYGDEDDRLRKQRVWLFPVFLYNHFSSGPGEWESDYFAPFPFVFGGDSSREGPYFALLPLAGTLKGLFGQDEITFIGGPLYIEAREGESYTWHFPWPFLRYGEGPRYKTHAVLPLYAYSRQDGDYERYTVLWPLVSWGEDQLGTRWPRKYWAVLPFAMRSWTAGSEYVGILPPFFSHTRIDPSNTTILDAPWPIFRIADGDRYEEFRIWPLYRRYRFDDDWTTNVAWPFIWVFDEKEPGWEEQRVWVLPLWFSRTRTYDADKDGTIRTEGGWDLWPLARHRHAIDGSWSAQFPAILPPMGERFERLYGPLLRLAHFEAEPGRHNTELLWGMYKHREDETGKVISTFPFFTERETYALPDVKPTAGDPEVGGDAPVADDANADEAPKEVESKEFSVLGGLIGHKSENGKTRIRILWFISFEID